MTCEALVFYSPVDDPKAWRKAFATELPDIDFRVDPDVGDPDEISFALTWLPPKGFFQRFRNLKLVTNLGAGADALLNRDDLMPVPITRLSDPGMVSLMTSYVVFAVTRYARDMHIFERATRRGEWHYVHPRSLSEIKVGVLGLGELGAHAAQTLAQMGFDVHGWSRTQKDIDGVACSAGREALDTLLSQCEIIVSLLPATGDTRALLGARELALMPHGAKFINASRSSIVDEEALLAALRSGAIGEATLDVFNVEPLPNGHPIWELDNVLVTPHLASITIPELAVRNVAESIRRVRRGEEPLHRVDPARGY
jgi:glyoxylate/hydroxypyruvate reductase A